MKKWLTVFSLLLGFISCLNGTYYPYETCTWAPPCNGSCSSYCGGFNIGADFIYWKPCIDDLDYAIQYDSPVTSVFSGTTNGSFHYVDTKWEPGVRGFVGKDNIWCGWDFIGSYTWLQVKRSDSVDGVAADTLFSTVFPFPPNEDAAGYASLSARYRLQYQTFDLLLATNCSPCNCHYFIPFFGFTGIFLDQKFDHSGIENGTLFENNLRWHNDYWGLGIKIGAEYRYKIADGLYFETSASSSVVAGDSHTKRVDRVATGTEGESDVHRSDRECLFLNGYHITSEFVYEDCWCNWNIDFRFGYEFVKWYDIPIFRKYNALSIAPATSASTRTLGFHGLLAGLTISY